MAVGVKTDGLTGKEVLMEHWYLAKSKPRKERLLAANLERWDVETFYPYMRRSGSQDAKMEPLFPTYIFCRFDQSAPTWQAIRWAPALAYFLKSGDEIARIDDSLVEHLQAKILRWNQGISEARFNPGDRVKIVDGPFAGFTAMFKDYLPARERCRILLESVPSMSNMEIPERDLELARGGWRSRFATDLA